MIFIFYITLFLFILGHGLLFNSIDNDFFARLIVGKTYFQTGSLLDWDFLSYTPTHRFIDHEWGSSLVFYFLQSHFGDAGLLIFKAIIYFATFYLITKVILLRNKEEKLHFLPFWFLINAIPAILFATLRCQAFTFFFFALWLYTLELVRLCGHTRLLWILPATMLVWANMHGGCAAGIGLLVLYIAGEFLNKKSVKSYIITLIFTLLALFINPYGIPYLEFLIKALTLKREFITEWQSSLSPLGLKFHFKYLIFAAAFLCLTLFYTLRFKINFKKIDKTKALVLAVTFLMALKSIRLQPFFILSAAAFCYSDFYKLFPKRLPASADRLKEIFFLVLMTFFVFSSAMQTKFKCVMWEYPIMEIDFLKANKIKGNLLCEFHDGSYAAYRLWPDVFIFMDGKYEEVYPDYLIYMLRDINLANKGYLDKINKYRTDIIIVAKHYKIYQELKKNKDFKLMLESPKYALFLKKELIRSDFKTPAGNAKYYIKTKYDTNIDWSVKNES